MGQVNRLKPQLVIPILCSTGNFAVDSYGVGAPALSSRCAIYVDEISSC